MKEHRRLVWAAAALVIIAIACGNPGPRDNPYDPNVPVTASITGPDTLFSYAELANFSSASPPLEPATLSIVVAASVGAIDTTVFRDIAPQACPPNMPGGPVPTTIDTKEYRHSVYKNVVLTQRLTRIQLRCPDTHACDTLAAGGSSSIWVDGFDALGDGIYTLGANFAPARSTTNPATGPPIATYMSRDTTIAAVAPVGVRVAAVTARRSGTTWVVATRGTLSDSLQIVVR